MGGSRVESMVGSMVESILESRIESMVESMGGGRSKVCRVLSTDTELTR
jgi:hypothetical protein